MTKNDKIYKKKMDSIRSCNCSRYEQALSYEQSHSNALEMRLKEAIELLQTLHDLQNGSPLPSYEKEWRVCMTQIEQFIKEHSPSCTCHAGNGYVPCDFCMGNIMVVPTNKEVRQNGNH